MTGPSNNDNSDNSNKKPKGGRLYFTKPETLRVVAIQDPTGKRNLASNRIPSLWLRGMWMTRVGMEVGSRLAIEWEEDRIILRNMKVES